MKFKVFRLQQQISQNQCFMYWLTMFSSAKVINSEASVIRYKALLPNDAFYVMFGVEFHAEFIYQYNTC